MKNKLFYFTVTMVILFTISTIAMIFMVYNNINNDFTVKFAMMYLLFLFLFFIYIIFVAVFKLCRLSWIDIRKRLFKFISIFSALVLLNYIFKGINMSNFCTSFGIAFGSCFLDIVFFRKEKFKRH